MLHKILYHKFNNLSKNYFKILIKIYIKIKITSINKEKEKEKEKFFKNILYNII